MIMGARRAGWAGVSFMIIHETSQPAAGIKNKA